MLIVLFLLRTLSTTEISETIHALATNKVNDIQRETECASEQVKRRKRNLDSSLLYAPFFDTDNARHDNRMAIVFRPRTIENHTEDQIGNIYVVTAR